MSWEAASKQEAERIPQEVFQAYIDANLRYPLNYLAMSIYVGAELFRDPNRRLDPRRFARTEFSDDQLNVVKKKMNDVHAARGVQVRSVDAEVKSGVEPRRLSDERMRSIWLNERMTTLTMAAMLSGMNKVQVLSLVFGLSPDEDEEGGKAFRFAKMTAAKLMLSQLKGKLADPEVYKGVGEAFTIFQKVLTGPVGKEYSKSLRDLLDRRVPAKTEEEAKEKAAKFEEMLEELMNNVLLKEYRAQGGTYITPEMEKNWRSKME